MERYQKTFKLVDLKAGEVKKLGDFDGTLYAMNRIYPDDKMVIYATDKGEVFEKAREDFMLDDAMAAVTVYYER